VSKGYKKRKGLKAAKKRSNPSSASPVNDPINLGGLTSLLLLLLSLRGTASP
jgi:hypothetical protein